MALKRQRALELKAKGGAAPNLGLNLKMKMNLRLATEDVAEVE